MNPYFGQDFFGFFILFFQRIFSGAIFNPTTDEVQALVLMGVSAASSLIGSFLVLRKMTMLANSLSHTILLGIVGAFLLVGGDKETLQLNIPSLLIAAFAMGLITVFLTEWLTSSVKLQEDAATGLVFTTLFALGIIAVTVLTRSSHIGQEAVMGNVDALHVSDLKLVYTVFFINLVVMLLFFKEFVITSFDPGLAKILGISVPLFSTLLMMEASFVTIASFRSTGVLMVLSFLVIPPLIARLYTHKLKKMLIIAALLGPFISLIGVALSRHLLSVQGVAVSTSGLIVVLLTLSFALSLVILALKKVQKLT